jgi:hypothetical protein
LILTATARRSLENHEQRNQDEHRDHQQLELVDVSNDLRLGRDHGFECGASSGGELLEAASVVFVGRRVCWPAPRSCRNAAKK